MRELSADLTVLANQPIHKKDPAHNRALAQLLALSLQLDPTSQTAHVILQRHEKGMPIVTHQKESLHQDSLARIKKTLSWLLNNHEQKTGFSLALLILDPLQTLHPKLKTFRAVDLTGEAERWEGVVPSINAFRSPLSAVSANFTSGLNKVGPGHN